MVGAGARGAPLSVLLLLLPALLRGAAGGLADSVVWAVNAGGDAHVDVNGIHFRKDPLEGRVGRGEAGGGGPRRAAPPVPGGRRGGREGEGCRARARSSPRSAGPVRSGGVRARVLQRCPEPRRSGPVRVPAGLRCRALTASGGSAACGQPWCGPAGAALLSLCLLLPPRSSWSGVEFRLGR